MKKQFLVIITLPSLALLLNAANIVIATNSARFEIQYGTEGPAPDPEAIRSSTAGFEVGNDFFGNEGPPDNRNWGQIVQFDITSDDWAEFNDAITFDLAGPGFPGIEHDLYVSTKQLKEVSPGATTSDIMGQPFESLDAQDYIVNSVLSGMSNSATFVESYDSLNDGGVLIENPTIANVLSSETFDGSTAYVYFFLLPVDRWASDSSLDYTDIELVAVPEPSSGAFLSSFLILCTVLVRRRD